MNEEYTLRDTVFRALLKDQSLGPTEMSEHLDANYNSVKAAFAKLADDGLLERQSRGDYIPSYPGILLHILDRLEAIEKEMGGMEHV